MSQEETFASLQGTVSACHLCARLVDWRELVAREKVKRHSDETYWGKAVPSFGDPNARVLIVGLAPAAHGANRTGRMFTGDRSGEWLYRALHKAGFANQPESHHRDDGLALTDCCITAVLHCAPPDNKPLPVEIKQCRPYLQTELATMASVQVVIVLGKIAFDAVLSVFTQDLSYEKPREKPIKFGHGAVFQIPNGPLLIASYHPSQQNTFTGKLTEPMFDAVFARAKAALRPL